ncbi:MAG: cytochrome c [Deltaproteobacteria bacterium]|nr:cytochrome c [Deltaproteobacteria bacterium]
MNARILLAAPLLLVLGAGCRGNKSADPPVHPNLNMDFQQHFKAQERNAWFPDGRAMRLPVEGTVAQGQLREDDAFYHGRGPDGRLVDELPAGIALDAQLLARGEARYDIYCAPCHEKTGYGHGLVVQRGLKVPPPSYHDPRLQAMPLGYFYDVITRGKGTMKAYASQIPVADRWAIAAWVRVLQVSQRAELADVPADVRDSLLRDGGTTP